MFYSFIIARKFWLDPAAGSLLLRGTGPGAGVDSAWEQKKLETSLSPVSLRTLGCSMTIFALAARSREFWDTVIPVYKAVIPFIRRAIQSFSKIETFRKRAS
jgi:hypothetical protein